MSARERNLFFLPPRSFVPKYVEKKCPLSTENKERPKPRHGLDPARRAEEAGQSERRKSANSGEDRNSSPRRETSRTVNHRHGRGERERCFWGIRVEYTPWSNRRVESVIRWSHDLTQNVYHFPPYHPLFHLGAQRLLEIYSSSALHISLEGTVTQPTQELNPQTLTRL